MTSVGNSRIDRPQPIQEVEADQKAERARDDGEMEQRQDGFGAPPGLARGLGQPGADPVHRGRPQQHRHGSGIGKVVRAAIGQDHDPDA